MTQIVTEIIIDASGADRGSANYIRAANAAKAAADKLIDTNEKAAQAQAKQTAVMTGSADSIGKVRNQWENFTARVDPAVRATRDIEKATLLADAAIKRGVTTKDEAARVLALLTAKQVENSKVMELAASQSAAFAGRLGALGQGLMALGPAGLVAAGTIGGLAIAFKQAADAALELADRAGKLKDFSETTGFTVAQLQSLEHAGAQVGVSSDSVTKALERFSVQMMDVREATGPLYEQLLRMNPVLAAQVARAETLTEAWDLVARATRNASTEQANALAKAAFGRGGIEVTRLQRVNADAGGVNQLAAAMRAVDVITKEQADHWDDLGDTIAENMKLAKQNVVSLFAGPVLESLNGFSAGLLEMSRIAREFDGSTMKTFFDYLGTAIGAIVPGLNGLIVLFDAVERLGSSATTKVTVNAAPRDMKPGFRSEGADNAAEAARAIARQREETIRSYNETKRWMDVLGDAATPTEKLKLKQLELAAAVAKGGEGLTDYAARAEQAFGRDQSNAALSARVSMLGELASVTDIVRAKQNDINAANRQGAGIDRDAAAAILLKTQRLAEYSKTANIDAFDRSTVGMSPTDAGIASTLRSRGEEVNFDSEIAKYLRTTAVLKEAKADLSEFTLGFAHDFKAQLKDGANAWDAFASAGMNALDRLSDKLMDRALNKGIDMIFNALIGGSGGGGGGGGLASLFFSANGNAFDRGSITPFANGGVVNSPVAFPMGVAGEAGPEAIIPLRRGADGKLGVGSSGGGGGNSMQFSYAPRIDARGADAAAVSRLTRAMADDRKNFAKNVVMVVSKAREGRVL